MQAYVTSQSQPYLLTGFLSGYCCTSFSFSRRFLKCHKIKGVCQGICQSLVMVLHSSEEAYGALHCMLEGMLTEWTDR